MREFLKLLKNFIPANYGIYVLIRLSGLNFIKNKTKYTMGPGRFNHFAMLNCLCVYPYCVENKSLGRFGMNCG